MTLPEALLLLSLDDETGKRCVSADLGPGLAGGVLLELALADLIGEGDGGLVATGRAPSDPLLADAHAALAAEPGRHDAKGWLRRLPSKLAPLEARIARVLVARGVLEERCAKLLGVFERTRWPERDPGPERELVARLRAELLEGRPPEPRDALLLSLLRPYDLVRALVPRERRREAERAADGIVERGAVSSAVAELVDELVAAVTVTAAAAIATAAGTVTT